MKLLILISFFITACSGNLLDEIADKDTDEAVYFQAKQEINAGNYTTAIGLLESLSSSFLADRDRVPVYASAYSGRCGLVFLTLLNTMQNAAGGTVFTTLMGAFPGALATNVQDCINSETILEGIGDESARDGDENLLMAFTSLAKVGTILSSLADTDDDGVPDATFDQCDAGDLPENMVREFGSGMSTAILSLSAIGTSYIGDAVTDVNALCALDPNLNAFCSTTDPAAFTAAEVQALRYAIGSSDFGINSCGGNDFNACVLANPSCP